MSMVYDRDSLGPRTNTNNKEVGDLELVYATITKIYMGWEGRGRSREEVVLIEWKHITSGSTVTHTISSDKARRENCYNEFKVGHTYIIVQRLMAKEPKVRWLWEACRDVLPHEAKLVAKKCGSVDIDLPTFGKMMEVLKEQRQEAEEAKKQGSLVDMLVVW